MKKLVVLFAVILFTNFTYAQDYSIEEVEVVQNLFGAEKKVIIEAFVDLEGVDAAEFWSLYEEYEVIRKELGKERIALLHEYETIKTITNEEVEALMKKAMPLRKSQDALTQKYYKKIKKATSAIVGAQFYQIEHFISDGVRFTILNNMGLVQDKK